MDGEALERVYQENLEERIIAYLAEIRNISLETAMDIYYHSKLANKIHRGVEGIQYLDYKVLVQILCETEKELFCEIPVDIAEIDVAISESENEYAQNVQLHDARSALASLRKKNWINT